MIRVNSVLGIKDDVVFSKKRLRTIRKEIRWLHDASCLEDVSIDVLEIRYARPEWFYRDAYFVLYSINSALYVGLFVIPDDDGSIDCLFRRRFNLCEFVSNHSAFLNNSLDS